MTVGIKYKRTIGLREDAPSQEVDSLGNPLSTEQIKFFANSKVRDSQGNLLVCYHGTPNTFDEFRISNGQQGKYGSYGIYFSDETTASGYGSTKGYYLNANKVLYVDANGDPAVRIFTDIISKGRTGKGEPTHIDDIAYYADEHGYDGVIVDNVRDNFDNDSTGHIGSVYIVFNPNQIKSITNTNPTNSNNINENRNELKDNMRESFTTNDDGIVTQSNEDRFTVTTWSGNRVLYSGNSFEDAKATYRKANKSGDYCSFNDRAGRYQQDKLNESRRPTVDIEYEDLHVEFGYNKTDVDMWDEFEDDISYTYKADKGFVVELIADWFYDEPDCPLSDDASSSTIYKYVEDNFDSLFERYGDKLREFFREDAERDAAENYNINESKSNELEQRAKKHKKKSKGMGWHMSMNAGDVEKGMEVFNNSTSGTCASGDCGGGMGESLSESSGLNTYIYDGPVYYEGRKISETSNYSTEAPSKEVAARNIWYQVSKNSPDPFNYDIVDERIKLVPGKKKSYDLSPNRPKCHVCGFDINDNGDCPVCDYGELDLLESLSDLEAMWKLNNMDLD